MRPICLLPRHLPGCNYIARLQLSCFFSRDLAFHLQAQCITLSVHFVTWRSWLVLALCRARGGAVRQHVVWRVRVTAKSTYHLRHYRPRVSALLPLHRSLAFCVGDFHKNLHRKSKFGCSRAKIKGTST